METIIKKDWDYILYRNEQKYILEVVCGSVAIFEIKIQLNKEEMEDYFSNGEKYISQLVEEIRSFPNQWIERKI